jgi:hypothetical protein
MCVTPARLQSTAMTQTPIEDHFTNFQPCQILCLEHQNTCLYVELIQVAAARLLYWVRPVALAIASDLIAEPDSLPSCILYDLRQGADLLWPPTYFRAALDTEVIPLLAKLEDVKAQSDGDRTAHQQLRDFMQRVWQSQVESPIP